MISSEVAQSPMQVLIDPPPIVSVITILANQNTFDVLLGHLRLQSLASWEWLIVLDADADADLLAYIRLISNSEARIHVLHASYATHGQARNVACAQARGRFLAYVEADIEPASTWLEKCLWAIADNQSIEFSNAYSMHADSHQPYTYGFGTTDALLDDDVILPAVLIRADTHRRLGQFDPNLSCGSELWDYWLRLAAIHAYGYTIPEILSCHKRVVQRSALVDNDIFVRDRTHIQVTYSYLAGRSLQARLPDPLPFEEVREELLVSNILPRSARRHVLLVIPWMVIGGADRVNIDLLQYLRPLGYSFTIVTTLPYSNPWIAKFQEYTSDIFCLNQFLHIWDYPRFITYLIHSRQIDTVLLSNSYLGYQLLPYLRSHSPDAVFMDYVHAEDERWRNGGYPRCGIAYQEMLDLNVTSNAYIKAWMVARGADASRIAVCHTNIDTQLWFPRPEERGPVRQMLDLPETTTLITFVGRLAPEKRPYMLAQIVRGLLDSGRDRFMLLVIGDGPERIKLDQTIDSLNVSSHIRVLGGLQEDALRQIMAASDMFCLPSLKEGISVAIYEAMAMGVVPIGALVGGQAELVTPECGVLIAHGDAELSTYIESIGRLIDDAAVCEHMGMTARQRVVEHFRIDLIGERMNALIDQAHALSQSDPRLVLPKRLGREIATQAIELLRLEGALDSLWSERERLRQMSSPSPPSMPVIISSPPLFRRLLNRVKRVIEPWRGR